MNRIAEQHELDAAIDGRHAAVLFHATWCQYCRSYRPVFEKELDGAGPVAVEDLIDDEANPLWETCSIKVIPTVILFDVGKVTRRLDGRRGEGLDEGEFRRALEK